MSGGVLVAVVGAHLAGQPLNYQLTDRGAVLFRSCLTAPKYKLFALAGTVPPKPGMIRVSADGGAIALEVWSMSKAAFGDFVAMIPSPLGIGKIELEDGTFVSGFICEGHAVEGARDITSLGGWRAFLKHK